MENLKSKQEQSLETLFPDKSPETIRQMMTIIQDIEKEMEMEQFHMEMKRKFKEAEDDMANCILTA